MADSPKQRDAAARQADLDWLYEGKPPVIDESSTGQAASFESANADAVPIQSATAGSTAAAKASRTSESASPRAALKSGLDPQPAPNPRPRVTPAASPADDGAAKSRPAEIARPARKARPAADSAPAEATPSRGSRRTRPRPRRTARRLFRTLLLLVLAWLVFLVAVPVHALSTMVQTPGVPAGARPPRQPGTVILLAGTDSREGLSPEERERLGTGDAEGHRADTMMLLYKPRKGRSALISLPRDSYVEVPGYGPNKLNAAYAFGGPALLQQTVEQNTGVRIDGYLEIGFGGFANLVDAVGGVEVCLDQPMQDELAHIDLPAGCQTLDGAKALGYVRMRYSDPKGDLGRAERQREVISKVADKVAKPATFINPFRYRAVNQAVAKTVAKSDDTGNGDLLGGALGLANVAKGDGLTLQVPIADPSAWSPDGQSIVVWDDALAAQMFDEIARGDTSQLDRFG